MATQAPDKGAGRGGGPWNRGRGGGSAGSSSQTQRPPKRQYHDGLDPTPLQSLERPKDPSGQDVEIKDLVYIGSYNWVHESQRTIVVPGETF